MSVLRLDWAAYDAALYACQHWHYSRCMPAGRTIKFGVWEDGTFKGVIIFSRGATVTIGSPYSLRQTEICELTRVALREHVAPVSRMVAIALRLLKKFSPGLRLVISYAAGEENHHGGIYQAGGWIYEGAMDSYSIVLNGERIHARSVGMRYGRSDMDWLRANVDPNAHTVRGLVRHKYLMPLDELMRAQVTPLSKPYPRRQGTRRMARLHPDKNPQQGHWHWCPACQEIHRLPNGWQFNGNLDSPTFTPSFKHTTRNAGVQKVCHYILTDGVLNYCPDCDHSMKEQAVPLPEIPEGELERWGL